MMTKIFYVDRFIKYSTKMFEVLWKVSLQEKNYQIFFLGPDDKKPILFSNQKVSNALKIWSSGDYVRKIFRYLLKNVPDIVHFTFELRTYGPIWAAIRFPILLFLIRRTKIKIVVSLFNVWFYKDNSKWELPDYFPIKIPRFFIKFIIRSFFKAICNLSHKIVVGTYEAKSCLTEYFGIDKEKIEVIQFGVSQTRNLIDSSIQKKYRELFSDKKIILYFGVISPRKNQEVAIKAFKIISEKIPDYVLVIAGKSTTEFESYEKNLRKLVGDLNLEQKVFFTGFIDDDDIDVLFQMAEMVLYIYLPMSDSTYSITLAIENDVPIIVSNIKIFKEILSDKSALFVEPKNEIQLSDAMLKLSTNHLLRNQIQEELKSIAEKLSWENIARQYLKLYENLLK